MDVKRPRTAGPGFLVQNAPALGLQVVELAAQHRPSQDCANEQHKRDRQGNEQVERFHGVAYGAEAGAVVLAAGAGARRRLSRSELASTMAELSAMPAAATSGESRPMIASGIMAAL